MKKVLIFGGNRFFGTDLVKLLLAQGHEVTLANRGTTPDPFGDSVDRIVIDRTKEETIKDALGNHYWDLVYDQICYSSNEADITTRLLKDKVGHYVQTSTGSVYDHLDDFSNLTEPMFNPTKYPIKMAWYGEFEYGEGKRFAESVYFQKADFPVSALRFPIVLGKNDYTGRFKFHVDRTREGKNLFFYDAKLAMSMISEEDAGSALFHVGENKLAGTYNAHSGVLNLGRMLEIIEQETGKTPLLTKEKLEENKSPYRIKEDFILNIGKLKNTGWAPENNDIDEYVRGLVNL